MTLADGASPAETAIPAKAGIQARIAWGFDAGGNSITVIPAKAGTHLAVDVRCAGENRKWVPAFAGMAGQGRCSAWIPAFAGMTGSGALPLR